MLSPRFTTYAPGAPTADQCHATKPPSSPNAPQPPGGAFPSAGAIVSPCAGPDSIGRYIASGSPQGDASESLRCPINLPMSSPSIGTNAGEPGRLDEFRSAFTTASAPAPQLVTTSAAERSLYVAITSSARPLSSRRVASPPPN